MTEAEAKLQLRRIEQFNAVNVPNRFKFELLEPAIAKGLRELRDRLRAESVKVLGGGR